MSVDMYNSERLEDDIKNHIKRLASETKKKDFRLEYVDYLLNDKNTWNDDLYSAYDISLRYGSNYLVIFNKEVSPTTSHIKKLKEEISYRDNDDYYSISVRTDGAVYFEEIHINRDNLITAVWMRDHVISMTYQHSMVEKQWKHLYMKDMSVHYKLINENDLLVVVA